MNAPTPLPRPGLPRWFWSATGLCLLLTSVPYLWGWSLAGDRRFMGFLHYPDDQYVYLAWIDQARQGRLLFDNRFTALPQHARFFNLLFLLLGRISGATGLSPLATLQASRLVFAPAALWAVFRLFRIALPDEQTQKIAFLLVCFSSGLGAALAGLIPSPIPVPNAPVDLWQPEAITFLSLYQNALFAAALALTALALFGMVRSRQTDRTHPAFWAGVAALVVANIHSYDIVTLDAAWLLAMGLTVALGGKLHGRDLGRTLLFLALPMPAVLYQARLFLADPLFHQRAEVPTSSAPLGWVLLGYGLLVPAAIAGAAALIRSRLAEGRGRVPGESANSQDASLESPPGSSNRDALALFGGWALAGLLLEYAPVAFQRKLLMGTHVPMCGLAAVGVVHLIRRVRLPQRRLMPALLVALTVPTNLYWLAQDMGNAVADVTPAGQRPYLEPSEVAAGGWLRAHAHGEAVLALPLAGVAGYLPGWTGNRVYAGHWGETPDFSHALRNVLRFYRPDVPNGWRVPFLQTSGVRFVWSGIAERAVAQQLGLPPPDLARVPGLRLVFQSGAGVTQTQIYAVGSLPIGDNFTVAPKDALETVKKLPRS